MSEDFPYNFKAGETLLIDKPLEWTSFDVVKKLRSRVQAKVGHAGTLDPLATGLLIICTGKNTKKINELQNLDKEYTGEIYLGATTPSYDREMEPDRHFPTDHITEAMLHATARQFIGEQLQHPPAFSAIKKGGEKLYHRARRGEQFKTDPRSVHIHEFEITGVALPLVQFRVRCSKGTYIRSLAHDFGKALNSGGYLHSLVRTKIGPHKLEDAWQLDKLVAYLNEHKALILRDAGTQGN